MIPVDGDNSAPTHSTCGSMRCTAAASWVAESAAGRSLAETGWMNPLELAEMMELPDHKLGVLLVVEDALRDASVRAGSAG